MKITKALSDYLDSVNKHIADWGDFYPVERTSNPEMKFVRFAFERDMDPAEVGNVIHRVRKDEQNMPTHLLEMAGALGVFFSQQ